MRGTLEDLRECWLETTERRPREDRYPGHRRRDEDLGRQYDHGVRYAFIGPDGAVDSRPRRKPYERARSRGLDVVTVVHLAGVVSPSARVERRLPL